MISRRVAAAMLAASPCLAQAGVQDRDQQEHSFPLAAGFDPVLVIDAHAGAIEVTTHTARHVRLMVTREIEADSAERLEAAKREVTLDLRNENARVSAYVDGPFRSREGRFQFRGRKFHGYSVTYGFRVAVPAETELRLNTVNKGDITARSIAGKFDIDNVNGAVTLEDVSGYGRAYALNRKLAVSFRSNPKQPSYFGSLNGVIEVRFQPGLSADVLVKTFNGGVYTDFDISPLPLPAAAPERREGKWRFKSNEYRGFRIGQGGPELKFDAFNGDIRILNAQGRG